MSTRRQPQRHTLDDVRNWHEGIIESLDAHRAATLASFHGSSFVPASRFFGMTRDEIDEEFGSRREELDSLTILGLMASAEAAIREDYRRRVAGARSDTLSKAYLVLHRGLPGNQRLRPSLEDDILDTLKDSGVVSRHVIGDFRDALRLRHWLAHGRYWLLTLGKSSYAPDDIYHIAHALLAALAATSPPGT